LDEFNKSINYINEILEKFKDKKAIIITHYSISEKVITKEFVNHIFNTTFTSKNEDIFKSFENIVLFIHGHCHTHLEYKINGIPVVCNAFGMSPIEKAKYVHNFTVEI
jgi:calcineurin-like phosphoesterase family protein